MDFLKRMRDIKWTPRTLAKAVGVGVAALLLLALALALASRAFPEFSSVQERVPRAAPAMPESGGAPAMGVDLAGEARGFAARGSAGGVRTGGYPQPAPEGGSVGADAEEFEAQEYSLLFEEPDKVPRCRAVLTLKEREEVVFEDAREWERGCAYTFKVARSEAQGVLSLLQSFSPKEMSARTYTTQKSFQNIATEEETLEKKLEAIDQTLQDALAAYEELTSLARRTGEARALSEVIDSKVRTLERLTQERVRVVARLSSLARRKAEAQDRLAYTRFRVEVRAVRVFDAVRLRDEWHAALRTFVDRANGVLEDMTLRFAFFLLVALQWALYLWVFVWAGKRFWRLLAREWKK